MVRYYLVRSGGPHEKHVKTIHTELIDSSGTHITAAHRDLDLVEYIIWNEEEIPGEENRSISSPDGFGGTVFGRKSGSFPGEMLYTL